jgi:hypothetical protein
MAQARVSHFSLPGARLDAILRCDQQSSHPLKDFIAVMRAATEGSTMILMTQSQLLELVEELRGMAAATPTAKVRDALARMADRYAARAANARRPCWRSTDYTGAPFAQQSGARSPIAELH